MNTREYYEAAIARLEAAAAASQDAQQIEEIYRQIARLRYAMIDQSFDQIVRRTALLQLLLAELQAAINTAGGITATGVIDGLTGLADQVQAAIDTVTGAVTGVIRGVTGSIGGARGKARGIARGGAKGLRRASRDIAVGSGKTLTVLCIHGIGDHHSDHSWQVQWTNAITSGLHQWAPGLDVQCRFEVYDHLFDQAKLDATTIAAAIYKLTASGIIHGIADLFRRTRGIRDLPEQLRWTAGMVAQWADDKNLRKNTRGFVEAAIKKHRPTIVAAHSLGSLITYDTFRLKPGLLRKKYYLTFGSQIGNPFVRSSFAGRIEPIEAARNWYHLYNEEDNAFAAELRIIADNFDQVATLFQDGGLDHDAIHYLSHRNTIDSVWREIAIPEPAAPAAPSAVRAMSRAVKTVKQASRKPQQRALLIGINDYPNPADRLEGCVNDVFRVSASLQESGFDPEDIRVVFDDRATTAGILERLRWLLDGVCPGDTRFLFYSGHGAQIPTYGVNNLVDHINECLVPWDFDWNSGLAITDRQFFELYSQLPYDSNFVAVFDCCHSGGMTRHGGHKVRGLTPPDDIRHRSLRWDIPTQMWAERDLLEVQKRIGDGIAQTEKANQPEWTGASGVEMRLGRANALRLSEGEQNQRKKEYGHKGPYTPVLIQACQADQLAYEYRDGVTSYGAFTFALTTALRAANARGKPITWKELAKDTAAVVKRHKYDQVPSLVGPTAVISKPVPFGQRNRKDRTG